MTDFVVEVVSDLDQVIDVVGDTHISISSGERVIEVIEISPDPIDPGALQDLVLSYSVSGQLIRVEQVPSGLATELEYVGNTLVAVTDYRGTRSLEYTGNVLTSVTWV